MTSMWLPILFKHPFKHFIRVFFCGLIKLLINYKNYLKTIKMCYNGGKESVGEKMEIIYKKLEDLKPYIKNPRFNDDAVQYVANSIKEFGFKVPMVIDKDGTIIAGHTRYKASMELGLKEVPCIVADDLNEEQIKAFRLADNKVSEKAEWNYELLDEKLKDILNIDMSNFGFDLSENLQQELDEIIDEPEVKFTEILGEEHNYIVLYFDNEVDWLQAESLFDLQPVYNLSTRKDGEISDGMKSKGIGRVINGSKAINKILGEDNEN